MLCDDVWSLQFYNLKLITRCLGSHRAANIIIILTSRTKSPLMYKLMEDKNCVRVRLVSSWLTTSSQRLSFEPRPVKMILHDLAVGFVIIIIVRSGKCSEAVHMNTNLNCSIHLQRNKNVSDFRQSSSMFTSCFDMIDIIYCVWSILKLFKCSASISFVWRGLLSHLTSNLLCLINGLISEWILREQIFQNCTFSKEHISTSKTRRKSSLKHC